MGKDGQNGSNGNGRGQDGRFLPAGPGGPGRPPAKLRITDYLHQLAEEETDDKLPRGKQLAKAIFSDAIGSHVPALVKTHARDYIGQRIDPVARDATDRPLVPLNVEIYDQRTVAFLEDLSESTGGMPTTDEVLNKLRALPIPRLLDDEGSTP